MKKKALIFLSLFVIVGLGIYAWDVHFNYRFETIDENKVYKSAAIPPEKLADYIQKYHIKTVIDLRDGGSYSDLNPVNQSEIDAEASAISSIKGVEHINIPSHQVPTRETLTRFLTVMDDKSVYPVLIHCHHGTGRAQIYSALYRIEYLNMEPNEARLKTSWITEFLGYKSAFAVTKDKGRFLVAYRSRNHLNTSTLDTLLASSFTLTMK
jgi:protein tyrosine phosphatase (PTP) superfamily phosphohydrolase (DUF442 family)